jgi:outer membrane immunogenic protein
MNLSSFGRRFVGLVVAASVVGVPVAAGADEWRVPSISYATDAELGPLTRTGFILSPDFNISDEVTLGGTGGALLSDPDGFSLGAKVGYDKQFGNVVVGVIADGYYSWADGGGSAGYSSDLNYYGTVRGKLGYALGRFLPYATAGYAFGELEVSNGFVSESETLNGWVYGGGLEFVWNKDITLHAGYRKIDFDDQNFSVLPVGQQTLSPEMDVFDFGLVRRY